MGRIVWDTNKLVDEMAQRVIGGVDATTDAARAHAARITPVRTGDLQRGWEQVPAARQGMRVRGGIRNDVFYAPFVNFGTSRMVGQHMLEQAVDAEFPRVSERIARGS